MTNQKIEKTLKPRQLVYKRVKVAMPHCPICKKQLSGDNSLILPYRCDCGEWESDYLNPGYFRIKI